MMQESDHAKKRFAELAVTIGGYPSAAPALYRCRQTFKGVDLDGKSVLEIGAGAGAFSAYAAAYGASFVLALEPEAAGSTEGYVSKISQTQEQMQLSNFEFRPDTIQDFDAAGRRFDVVLLYNSINHLDEPACIEVHRNEAARATYRKIFAKIAGMMTPGGKLIIADCSRHNFFDKIGLRNPLARQIEWYKHQSPRTWVKLLAPLGFKKERIGWHLIYALRRLGVLFANPIVSFFLISHFRMVLTYELASQ